MEGYTVYFTYMLSNSGSTGFGYGDAIHCNYINSLQIDSISNKEVGLYFNNVNDLKFLTTGNVNGSGFTANKIYVIAQLVNNSLYSTQAQIKPSSDNWRIVDVTNQIRNRVSGSTANISAIDLASSIFKVNISQLNLATVYDLNYLNYPLLTSTSTELKFGDEEYFLGNVSADIEAMAYTTDLVINLPQNQFNSSTNATWDGNPTVYITEIGLYDANNNLVAIGKLNNPIAKDSTVQRTILFAIDF